MYVLTSPVHFRGCMNLLFPSFWIIAIPLMSILTPWFLWSDMARGFHHIKKRVLARRISKARPDKPSILSDMLTRTNRPLRGTKSSETAIFVATSSLRLCNLPRFHFHARTQTSALTLLRLSFIFRFLIKQIFSGITFKYTHSLEHTRTFGCVHPCY